MDSPVPTLASADDRACADRLAALRWPEGFRCEDCKGSRHYRLAKRPRVFECARCRHQQSVTAGTAMHRSRVPLACWFVAAALMTRSEGVSAAELERHLGVTYETAWQLLHKVRAALSGEPAAIITGLAELVLASLPVRPPRGVRGYGPLTGRGTVVVLAGKGAEGAFAVAPRSHHARDVVPAVRARATGPILTSGLLYRTIAGLAPVEGVPTAAIRTLRQLQKVVLETHRSVSKAWLGRYLQEFGFRANRVPSSDDIVQHALAATWLPFSSQTALARAA